MNEVKEYNIIVFTEDVMGILARVVGVITRRHINIESVNASKSSIQGIHKIIIVVKVPEERIEKLVKQIDKQIDILKTFYYSNDEIVYQEIALYKVPSNSFYQSEESERLLRKHNARILSVEPEYIVIEKTGYQSETESLLEDLQPIGVYEFVRSGRVAICKAMERLNAYLRTVEKLAN